jgi:hypothetical protein
MLKRPCIEFPLIKMPAPVRAPKKTISIANDAIFASNEVQPTAPVIVRPPGSSDAGQFLERFTEVIMFGVAMLAIWIGLLSIAFADDVGEEKFLILFIGGLLSSAIALFMVELQAKKNDNHLMISQNYLLGLSFFFMAVGLLWGIRYVVGYLTLGDMIGDEPFNFFGDNNDGVFVANANLIYAQAIGAALMCFGHQRILKRYKGETSFGWAVASYIPLGLLLVGVGTWIEWADYEVSYPLGTAIVGLSGLAMYTALQSNKAINFGVVSVVSGLIPIVYEILNENAGDGGEGGALSLLVFIIIIQGTLASSEKLKRELVEKMSFFLIGEVIIAMLIADLSSLNLILGPIKSSGWNNGLENVFTLPVALWLTLLLAYFPAAQQNRVPAMPIGLAFALWTLDGNQAIMPWCIALVMIAYMMFFAEATRKWVANLTMSALSFSYLFGDFIGNGILNEPVNVSVAIGIIVIAETARRLGKISIWSNVQSVVFITLSSTILESPYWYVTWIFVAYLLSMVYESMLKARDGDDMEKRNATLALLSSLTLSSILLLLGKLELPDSFRPESLNNLSIEFMLLGLLVYALFNSVRDVELDFGKLLDIVAVNAAGSYSYDAETNAWYLKDEADKATEMRSYGTIARPSLAFALLAISIGISTLDPSVLLESYFAVGLYLLPVSLLIYEVYKMDIISSESRALGTLWLLIIAGASMPLMTEARMDHVDGLFKPGIVWDLVFLLTPVAVHGIITKRGLDRDVLNRGADQVMLGGLLVLGMLDQSGGLLFLTMYGLVGYTAFKYRHHVLSCIAPLAFISMYWLEDHGLAHNLLDSVLSNVDAATNPEILWFSEVTGLIVGLHMMLILSASLFDIRSNIKNNEMVENPYPWVIPAIWFLFSVAAVLPTASWLPLIAVIFGILNSWIRGDLTLIPMFSVALIFSFMIGFSDGLDDFSGAIFGTSMLWSGIVIFGLWLSEQRGILHMNVREGTKSFEMELPLEAQLRFLAMASLLLSFNVFGGVGMIAASAWATQDAFQKGNKISILFLPLLHGLTVGNELSTFDVLDESMRGILVGAVFFIEGGALIIYSSKTDQIYDSKMFDWESDDEFFSFVEYMGFAGVISALTGVIYALGEEQTKLALFITTALLTALAITGFDSKHSHVRWRRALGVYGSMITLIILFNEIDETIFKSLTIVLMGLLALGYGFIYQQRRHTIDVRDTEEIHELSAWIEEAEVKPASTGLMAKAESVDEDDIVEEITENIESVVKKAEEVAKAIPVPKPVKATPVKDEGFIETLQTFDVRMPPQAIEQIKRTIAMTPHEGFNPVVRVNMLGQIVLDFEPK